MMQIYLSMLIREHIEVNIRLCRCAKWTSISLSVTQSTAFLSFLQENGLS